MNEIELSDKDLKGYLAARSFTRAIGDEIVSNIKVGITEKEAEKFASGVFKKNSVKQHWHMPASWDRQKYLAGQKDRFFVPGQPKIVDIFLSI